MEAKLKIIATWKPGMRYYRTYRLSKEIQISLLMTNKTFGDTCLVLTVTFLQFFFEIRLAVETISCLKISDVSLFSL